MKHSSTQENFTTGAKRDTQTGKLRYDLISPLALTRLAVIYTKGAEHYGDRNWEKGMPFSRVMASLQRHLFAFMLGDQSEDHLAQMVWNGVALLHYQEAIMRGLLPESIDDMPDYTYQGGPAFEGLAKTDFERLVELDCPKSVARQIIGGTTYTSGYGFDPTLCHYVYIAGPMRGIEKFNFPAFDAAREALLKQGYNVISPADIDRYANPNAEDTTQDVSDQTRFVLRDFWANYFLRKIDQGMNGIVLLPGWPKSTGAAGEFFLDRWLGLKVYRPDGAGYPVDTAKHDFALAHAVATPASGCSTPEPTAGKYDGDWDTTNPLTRGRYWFYRIKGPKVEAIPFPGESRDDLPAMLFEDAEHHIVIGCWTRI